MKFHHALEEFRGNDLETQPLTTSPWGTCGRREGRRLREYESDQHAEDELWGREAPGGPVRYERKRACSEGTTQVLLERLDCIAIIMPMIGHPVPFRHQPPASARPACETPPNNAGAAAHIAPCAGTSDERQAYLQSHWVWLRLS